MSDRATPRGCNPIAVGRVFNAAEEERPASLSKTIITDLLRRELQYPGVILSDDLEMKAIAAGYNVPEAAVMAIEAGCDGALICSGGSSISASRARRAGCQP